MVKRAHKINRLQTQLDREKRLFATWMKRFNRAAIAIQKHRRTINSIERRLNALHA
jgi:hypothetical protein